MRIIYLDEQEGQIGERRYTAICGFSLPVEQLDAFRSEYYPELNRIVCRARDPDKRLGSSLIVHKPPLIHGRDLLCEFEDEVKFQILDHLFECLSHFECQYYRLGYFNKPLDEMLGQTASRESRLQFCLFAFWLQFGKKFGSKFMFAHEFDREGIRRGLAAVDDQIGMHYVIGESSPGNIPVDYRNFVGHFFATKLDIGCQVADVTSYIANKKNSAQTPYGVRIGAYFDRIKDKFLVNEVITMKYGG